MNVAGGETEDPEDQKSQSRLRALVTRPTTTALAPAPIVPKVDPKMIELYSMAAALGQACSSIEKLRKSVGDAIASRVRPREGKFIWQTATGSVQNLPREAALQIVPLTPRAPGGHTRREDWEATNMIEVVALVGPLFTKCTSYSAGATKALMTNSERVIWVVATVIPTAKIWWKEWHGIDTLSWELQYVLADEDGELHKPKDGNKNEIALEPELEETAVRSQILDDLQAMADSGAPLGPGFLRQLGRHEEAAMVEAQLHQQQQQSIESSKKRRKTLKKTTWDIDCILEEHPATSTSEPTFLVRWEGYHPSWEVYRATSNPGEVVTTWEPLSALENNSALHTWREEH